MLDGLRSFDPAKAQLFVQPQSDLQVAVGLQIELLIARLSGPVLRQLHQFPAVALPLRIVIQIELLQLRTAGKARKLRRANAADHLAPLIQGNKIDPLLRLGMIIGAELVQLRVEIHRSGDVQMESLQIGTDDLGNGSVVRRGDLSIIQHLENSISV